LLPLFGGCVHRGAVYSQVNHIGIQAKSDAQTGVPIKVSVGIDHALVALTPQHNIVKSEDDSDRTPAALSAKGRGEVGSLISRTELAARPPLPLERAIATKVYRTRVTDAERIATFRSAIAGVLIADETNPASKLVADTIRNIRERRDTKPALTHEALFDLDSMRASDVGLRARSLFIAGVPAIVASLPEDYTVTLRQDNGQYYPIRLKGTAEERVGSALGVDIAGMLPPELLHLDEQLRQLSEIDVADQPVACNLIVAMLPETFRKHYEEEVLVHGEGYAALFYTKNDYLEEAGLQVDRESAIASAVMNYLSAYAAVNGEK
jgi:hypothetical protein